MSACSNLDCSTQQEIREQAILASDRLDVDKDDLNQKRSEDEDEFITEQIEKFVVCSNNIEVSSDNDKEFKDMSEYEVELTSKVAEQERSEISETNVMNCPATDGEGQNDCEDEYIAEKIENFVVCGNNIEVPPDDDEQFEDISEYEVELESKVAEQERSEISETNVMNCPATDGEGQNLVGTSAEDNCIWLAQLLPNLEDAAQAAACGAATIVDDLCAAQSNARIRSALFAQTKAADNSGYGSYDNEELECDDNTCVLCYKNVSNREDFATLPCCSDRPLVCKDCIILLSYDDLENRCKVGRCPLCQTWVKLGIDGFGIKKIESEGTCKVCNQRRPITIGKKEGESDEVICDACFLGKKSPLLYECDGCGKFQRIPHPMYRYQATSGSFSRNKWKCHRDCTGFTAWRLSAQEIFLIPTGDEPREWCVNYLQTARDKVSHFSASSIQGNLKKDGIESKITATNHSEGSVPESNCVIC
eukprot:CAMPEP_0116055088 /NCGR_PEP_ID=MMETSP0322-20121206/3191_1 /TAXON_ID=163516 /ORGANISM="Leptocylindrus danicus var. apora, Strain B651" /LENGTH=476 /DNA_ID=CAMNT_0003538609 /DNA_START=81 /DNA_END=1511 /DNA_ORIENTATION=-